jgi:hypothetical protein
MWSAPLLLIFIELTMASIAMNMYLDKCYGTVVLQSSRGSLVSVSCPVCIVAGWIAMDRRLEMLYGTMGVMSTMDSLNGISVVGRVRFCDWVIEVEFVGLDMKWAAHLLPMYGMVRLLFQWESFYGVNWAACVFSVSWFFFGCF